MKAIQETKYQCEKCKKLYASEDEAKECEAKPITYDLDVKVGDIVMITRGDGQGQRAQVESTFVIDRYWGHYAAKRYWHTVALTAKLIDSWGGRLLTFEDYRKI